MAFDGGQLSEREIQAVSAHLATCSSCCDQLDALSVPNHRLAQALQAPQADDVYQNLLDELQGNGFLNRVAEQTVRVDLGEMSTSTDSREVRDGAEPLGSWKPGDLFGPYRLKHELGRGGMGVVYLARHRKLRRLVALKFIRAADHSEAAILGRFEREMRAIGRVQHPNVVVAHDAGEFGGTHFIAMEYVDGETLSQLMERQGTLEMGQACEIIRQAALGLQHAHQCGMVHRDIKPGNVMIDQTGTVKILDLGIAQIDSQSTDSMSANSSGFGDLTSIGVAMGTLGYMSPEQALDARHIDARTDIYSLGVTFYRMISGQMPFPHDQYDTLDKFFIAISTQNPPSLSLACPDLPRDLISLVDAMIARDVDERVQSTGEVVERIDGIGTAESDRPIEAESVSVTNNPISQPSRAAGNRRGLLIAVGISALACILFAIFLLRTPYGTVEIEVVDHEVAVVLAENGIEIIDKETDRIWTINAQSRAPTRLPAGQYHFKVPGELQVTDESGVRISTNDFRLIDPQRELRLRIGLSTMYRAKSNNSIDTARPSQSRELETFQKLDELIARHEGTMTAKDDLNLPMLIATNRAVRAISILDVDLSDCKQFGNRDLAEMARYLRVLVQPSTYLTLKLKQTTIDATGLLALEGIEIDELDTFATPIYLSEIAADISRLSVVHISLGGNIKSEMDLLAVLGIDSLRSIRFHLVSTRVLTPSTIQQLANTQVLRISVDEIMKEQDLSESRDRIKAFGELKQLELLVFSTKMLVDASQVDFLAEALPLTRIRSRFGNRAPPPELAGPQLRSSTGFSFTELAGIAKSVPPEFELEFDAKRLSGKESQEGLGVSVAIRDSRALLVFGGWHNKYSAIEYIDGIGGARNSSRVQFNPFMDGKSHHFVIRVRSDSLTAMVDDETILHWQGDPSALSTWANRPEMGELYFSTWGRARFHVANLRISEAPKDGSGDPSLSVSPPSPTIDPDLLDRLAASEIRRLRPTTMTWPSTSRQLAARSPFPADK